MPRHDRILFVALIALATAGVGCHSDSAMDARIRSALREGADAIRADEARVRSISAAPGDRDTQTQRFPGTTNPVAAELSYVAADEARDVAGRLKQFNDQAFGFRPDGSRAPQRELDLAESLRVAQESSREYLNAEEENILAAIRLLQERHLWGPRLFNDTSLGISGSSANGPTTSALSVVNTLRATKRLPYGGELEARWVANATQQLRETVSGRYTQASTLALGGNVPLLRGAGLVAQESLIQSSRSLIYQTRSFERFRRRFLVDISADYFELLNTSATIANQERQLESLRLNARRTAARVEAGRIQEFEKGIADNEVLSAEASLASQKDQYTLQLERYKIRLGIPVAETIAIKDSSFEVPEPEIDLDTAAAIALDYRLDLQNTRDQLDDARRAVENARNNILPDLNASAEVGVPTDPAKRNGNFAPSTADLDYRAAITLSLPLDREVERLQLRATQIALEQRERDYRLARDNVVVTVRASLRAVELARFQLRLAEQQVLINERRLRGQQLQADTVDAQTIVDSNNALLNARNQRDRAKTNLRNAVLNFLLETDQLRVTPAGQLQPLPGMDSAPTTPAATTPAPTTDIPNTP